MKCLILGSGMIARGIVSDLVSRKLCVPTDITVLDCDPKRTAQLMDDVRIDTNELHMDVEDIKFDDLAPYEMVFSTVPYDYNVELTRKVIEAGTNMVDLGGNNGVVAQQLSMRDAAQDSGSIIIPDCGLAPGLASVLARRAINKMPVSSPAGDSDKYRRVQVAVGGLPLRRDHPLQYQICFSVHGLINEYIEDCYVLESGRLKMVKGLSGLQPIEVGNYKDLEAFYTSGGISTTAEHLSYIPNLNLEYKTIRYAGHRKAIRPMLDTFIPECREEFEDLLVKALPSDQPDMILIKVTASSGRYKYCLESITYDRTDIHGVHLSAMAMMTAYPTVIAAELALSQMETHGVMTADEFTDEDLEFMVDGLRDRGIVLNETEKF